MSDLDKQLRTVLARLELVSQVPAALPGNSSRSAEDPGGKRPAGGIDRKDDREPDHPQKSVEHFRRRAGRIHSVPALESLIADAESALGAWRRQPAPTKKDEPEYGTPQWKRYVGESKESLGELARRFGVSRAYIQQIRKAYTEAA